MWVHYGLKAAMSTVSASLTAPKGGRRLTSTMNDHDAHTPGPDHPIRPLLYYLKHLAWAKAIPPVNGVIGM